MDKKIDRYYHTILADELIAHRQMALGRDKSVKRWYVNSISK